MRSNEHWVKRDNDSPRCAGCAPVDTAQDVFGRLCCQGAFMPSCCPPGAPRSFSAELTFSLCVFSCYPFCGLSRRCCFSSLSRFFIACSHLAALSPYAETDTYIRLDSDFNISFHLLNAHVSIFGFLWYCFSHWRRALCDTHFPVLFQTSPSQTHSFLQCLPKQLAADFWSDEEPRDLSVIFMSLISLFQWTLPPAFICLLSFVIQLAHQLLGAGTITGLYILMLDLWNI